uniref:Uncharacterized protein n=1 Tax=Anguilla anguilla TaxID=7936 RepID=A0A0E9W8U3_ANGAN
MLCVSRTFVVFCLKMFLTIEVIFLSSWSNILRINFLDMPNLLIGKYNLAHVLIQAQTYSSMFNKT